MSVLQVSFSLSIPQWAPPSPLGEGADSVCSRCRSNDALTPYVKSRHLLSRLTFPLTAPSNGVASGRRSTHLQDEERSKKTEYAEALYSLYTRLILSS